MSQQKARIYSSWEQYLIGVASALCLAAYLGLVERASVGAAFLGGAGFGVGVLSAVKNLHDPLIPVASVGLIGAGALIGKYIGRCSGPSII